MKTIKEMVEIMLAFDRGEQIQVKNIADNTKWKEIEFPGWNWIYYDYRVKPKSNYIPFETAEEFFTAQRKHDEFVRRKIDGVLFHSFVNNCGNVILLDDDDHIIKRKIYEIYDKYEFTDGTPCGKEVEV